MQTHTLPHVVSLQLLSIDQRPAAGAPDVHPPNWRKQSYHQYRHYKTHQTLIKHGALNAGMSPAHCTLQMACPETRIAHMCQKGRLLLRFRPHLNLSVS